MKKVEYAILWENGLTNTNIFRAFTKKQLSREGIVEFQTIKFNFQFHGNGISLFSDIITTKYSYLPIAEYNISFHRKEIHNFAVKMLHCNDKEIPIGFFDILCEKGFISKLWDNFEIYYIPSVKVEIWERLKNSM